MKNGYIKIHRKILEWEWYDDPIVSRLFFHLLIKSNHTDGNWHGQAIRKGELLTGRKILAQECGFSEMQIRSALNKLKSTNEITIKTTNKNSIIKLNNYNVYQQNNQQTTQRVTNKQPTNNQQLTTNNKNKEEKECKNEKNIDTNVSATQENFGNKEVNDMLFALKGKVGISAFVDSGIERNIAKHCVNLLEKIGKDEFVRRLDILLNDSFHQKNCNKIRYIYNNIKGFIDQKSKSRMAIIS